MPYCYRIDRGRRLVISTASGRLTLSDVIAHRDQLRNDPEFDPDFDRLIDTSDVTLADLSHDEIKLIGSPPHLFFSLQSRTALIAPRAHVFGLARMLGVYLEASKPTQFQVFRDLTSALNWLNPDRLSISARAAHQ